MLHVVEHDRLRGWHDRSVARSDSPTARSGSCTESRVRCRHACGIARCTTPTPTPTSRRSRSTTGSCNPRIEPEVVFGLAAPIPERDDEIELLSSVEWMAAGFGSCSATSRDGASPHLIRRLRSGFTARSWSATPVAVPTRSRAGRGGTLVVRAHVVAHGERWSIAAPAPTCSVARPSHSASSRTVAAQPQFSAPAAGEVITTGTLTDAHAVAPGERWESDYGALGSQGSPLTSRDC